MRHESPPELRPLTERALARLPWPPALTIALWALVPWLNAAANVAFEGSRRSAIWEQSRVLVVLNYAALSIGVVLSLWGTRRITAKLAAAPSVHFRRMNSVAGPLTAAAVTAVVFGATAFVDDGWPSALLRLATWFVLGLALWGYLWVYASLLLGLHRLGREHVVAERALVDPSLGLRPLGGVAFMGLWMLLAWLAPLLLTGLPDLIGVLVGLFILCATLAAFFLSLYRLHRQMAEVKARELAFARALYAQAYEPVRAEETLAALDRQHELLGAADALERRAKAIHEWPIDEGTFARVVTIATSVVAMAVARLLLDPFGL